MTEAEAVTDPEQLGIGDVILAPIIFKKGYDSLTGPYETEYTVITDRVENAFKVRGIDGRIGELHYMDVDWIEEWKPMEDTMDIKILDLKNV